MRSGSEIIYVYGALASGEYFSTLGVPAAIGRTLTSADDQPGGGKYGPVAVISDAFWSRQFRRNPSAIGSGLILDQVHFTIVGVMPADFFGAEVGTKPNIWVPLWMTTRVNQDHCISSRSCSWLIVMARRQPGVLQIQAQTTLKAMSPRILRDTVPTDWAGTLQKEFLRWRLVAIPGAKWLDDIAEGI